MKSIKDYINESIKAQQVEEARTCVGGLNFKHDFEGACDAVDAFADELEAAKGSALRSVVDVDPKLCEKALEHIAAWLRGYISTVRDDNDASGDEAEMLGSIVDVEDWVGYEEALEEFEKDQKMLDVLNTVLSSWNAVCKKVLGSEWF